MKEDWKRKVIEYCNKYNIPLFYLAETMYEPKVVPMIRGKAFEFFVMLALKEILPKNEWNIDKPTINAQTGFHDIDVRVTHKKTDKVIRVECKLAKKGSYSFFNDGHSEIRVKCMRSRTLGSSKVKELAPKLGVNRAVLAVHNDQYLPSDFDVLITSIGNAFYRTDKRTGFFEWQPNEIELKFLKKFDCSKCNNLKDCIFNKLYIIKSKDLAITKDTGIICTRRKCRSKRSCGFIPNYPIIEFDAKTNKPAHGWIEIEKCSDIFKSFIK